MSGVKQGLINNWILYILILKESKTEHCHCYLPQSEMKIFNPFANFQGRVGREGKVGLSTLP